MHCALVLCIERHLEPAAELGLDDPERARLAVLAKVQAAVVRPVEQFDET
jgi:hypothetical protein